MHTTLPPHTYTYIYVCVLIQHVQWAYTHLSPAGSPTSGGQVPWTDGREFSHPARECSCCVWEEWNLQDVSAGDWVCVCGGGYHGTVYAASPLAPDSTFTHISLSLSLLALLALLKLYIHVHIQASTPFLFSLLHVHVFRFHSTMSLPLFSLFPQNLDVTVTLYNRVRSTVLEVEYPLIESQLAAIDQQLERAISELNWTSEGL